jgi:ribosomal protein S18 acetylase RimI-like enzyme
MASWVVEHGTLWALETSGELPPICAARVAVTFEELRADAAGELGAAMGQPGAEQVQERLRGGRRCFILRAAGQLAAYGWVTRGPECVGELERQFHLQADEAYVWDCATLPTWRGQRLYSALLSQIIRRLGQEGVPRIWIGASRQNQPSVRGFANAGFQPVVDLTYRRLYRLTLMLFDQAPARQRPLVAAAYRILTDEHERRFGRLVVGYKR